MRKVSALLFSSLMMGFAFSASAQNAAPAKTGSVYREGSFERSAQEMTSCAAILLKMGEPNQHYFVGEAAEWHTLTGAPKDDIETATWTVAARDTADRASEVKLLSFGASDAALSDTWGVLEACKTQR